MPIEKPPITSNINLYIAEFSECFKQIRYCVYGNLMHLTVEEPYSYYYETKEYFYIFVKAAVENYYYVISDSIYDETTSNADKNPIK